MTDKRKHPRLNVEIPVKCFVMDGKKKKKVSYELVSKTRNLSEGGFSVAWPKGWSCKPCLKCLAWVFNHDCRLKEEISLEEANKFLSKSIVIKIRLEPPVVPEPVKLLTKVAWVKQQHKGNEYEIGLSFLKRLDCQNKEFQPKDISL